MNEVERLYAAAGGSASDFARGYLEYVSKLLLALSPDDLAAVVAALLAARDRGAHIWLLGNGGSAATASHFANDLAAIPGKLPYRATSLSDSAPVITAIANDHGYEQIFERQLAARVAPGDVVIALSASGGSQNVIRAVRCANEHGCTTIGFTGFGGGPLKALASLVLVVPSSPGEYGPVEGVHVVLEHIVSNFLRLHAAAEAG